MSEVLFETERLLVRKLTAGEVNELFAVYSDAEAMRWVGEGKPITLPQCVRWVEVTEDNYATRGYGMSVLVERRTGTVVDFCGLVHPGGQEAAELKYALKRACWGKGYATEVAQGMLQYGQQVLHLLHIIATIAPQNTASQHVVRKAGMQLRETRANDDGTSTLVFAWNANHLSKS